MDNPLLKTVLVNFPDVDAASLPWPDGAGSWDLKDLEFFIGSGGFLKPKKKKADVKKPSAEANQVEADVEKVEAEHKKAEPQPNVATGAREPSKLLGEQVEERVSAFEVPGFSKERCAITMPVRVHCEDTTPNGHVRLESLTAFAERIRSLALKQIMDTSLADLKEQKLAILATEYVVEIVGTGFRVLDTLRIDTTPEFPCAPLFPWETNMFSENGELYMRGRFGLNLCKISDSGAYSGIDEDGYMDFTKDMRKWTNPSKSSFSPTALRFFNAYPSSGTPFTPTCYREATYVVRASDCDMYNVLFQARVPSMMESCHLRYDAMAMYVNIRLSVRPGESLAVHILSDDSTALFVCLRDKTAVLTAFGHYGAARPMCQEGMKCASTRLPALLKFCFDSKGSKPVPCEDFDLSQI